MNTLNIRPILKFRLNDMLKSVIVFLGVIILVTVGIIFSLIKFTSEGMEGAGAVSTYSMSSCVMAFVVGICTIREDVRLAIQNGISRKTAFVANMLGNVILSAILAVAGVIFVAVVNMVVPSNAVVTEFYYITGNGAGGILQYGMSTLFLFIMLIVAGAFGMFLSLLFYRLNKVWRLIVAIGVPVLLVFGLPIGMPWLEGALAKVFIYIFGSVWRVMAVNALLFVVFEVINWFMLRKAPIMPIKK